MSNKKKLILGVLVGVLIGVFVGTTYAIFSYLRVGENQQLITGDIYMHYKESNTLTLENMLPSSTYDPTKYFEFTIDGKNTNTMYDIYYDIILNRGDVPAGKTEQNRIFDKFIKFRLVEVIEGQDDNVIFTNKTYLDISSGKRIYIATIPKNTTSEITHKYRLYMWISNDVVIGNEGNTNIDYDMTTWNNLFASIKVGSTGDFTEKELPNEFLMEHILNNVGNEGIVAINYNGELASNTEGARDYRYSGSGRYCTYTDGNNNYNLQIDGDTCPSAYKSSYGKFTVGTSDEYKFNSSSFTELSNVSSTVNDSGLKNYITFNNEMWRIIGIIDGKIKLVKDLSLTTLPNTYTNDNGQTYEIISDFPLLQNLNYAYAQLFNSNWTTDPMMYYLNEENGYYGTINNLYKNMIVESRYYLGNINLSSAVKQYYLEERSSNITSGNNAYWDGKIAVLYPSDYAYAASSDNWNTLGSTYSNIMNNWMTNDGSIFNRFISLDNVSELVRDGGAIKYPNLSFQSFRPTLYLKDDVVIYSGDGSYENPFKIIQE